MKPILHTKPAIASVLLPSNLTNRSSRCKCLLPSSSARQTAPQPAPAPARTPLASSSHPQTKTRLHEPFRGIQYPDLQDSQLNGAHTIFLLSLVFFAVLPNLFATTRATENSLRLGCAGGTQT